MVVWLDTPPRVDRQAYAWVVSTGMVDSIPILTPDG